MSVFTEAELNYLAGQRLGRLVTLAGSGSPQVRPVVFGYNAELDTVDIRGRDMAASRKFRNVAADPRVAFVVDDLASVQPWRPRGVEIRGWAEAIGGSDGTDAAGAVDSAHGAGSPGRANAIGDADVALIRIHPRRVLGWGLDTGSFAPPRARDVGGSSIGGSLIGGGRADGDPAGGDPAGGDPTGGSPTGGSPTAGGATGGGWTGGGPTAGGATGIGPTR